MNHMNMSSGMHMNMPMDMGPMCGASAGGASNFLFYLGLFFFAGTLFYLFRLAFRGYLKQVNGYADPENEFWHGVCMMAMTSMLAPNLVSLFTPTLFLWTLPVGVIWYVLRAFTYGKKLPYNKQWYDLAHAAMLFGMWWMFAAPVNNAFLTGLFATYWAWFASYYAARIAGDFKKPHWLSFGQDIAHFVMAVVMVLMTLWPAHFMVMA
jgi:predicted membrane channel-forming protein YqfA (hemolysin III family)